MCKFLTLSLALVATAASFASPVRSALGGDSLEDPDMGPLYYDAEVEYLESTGTQWIDTGVELLRTDIVEGLIGATKAPSNNQKYIFAARERVGVGYGYFGIGGQQNTLSARINPGFVALGDFTEEPSFFRFAERDFYYNEVTSSFTYRANSVFPTNNLALFGCGSYDGVFGCFDGARIGAFAVERDGEVILDMIAVRIGNTGFMYDRISGVLFGNSGSGEFIIGPDL